MSAIYPLGGYPVGSGDADWRAYDRVEVRYGDYVRVYDDSVWIAGDEWTLRDDAWVIAAEGGSSGEPGYILIPHEASLGRAQPRVRYLKAGESANWAPLPKPPEGVFNFGPVLELILEIFDMIQAGEPRFVGRGTGGIYNAAGFGGTRLNGGIFEGGSGDSHHREPRRTAAEVLVVRPPRRAGGHGARRARADRRRLEGWRRRSAVVVVARDDVVGAWRLFDLIRAVRDGPCDKSATVDLAPRRFLRAGRASLWIPPSVGRMFS